MYDPEGPSQDDIQRFNQSGIGHCPECGGESFDDADICRHCGAWIPHGPSRRPPRDREAQRKLVTVIAIVTLLGFLALAGVLRIL